MKEDGPVSSREQRVSAAQHWGGGCLGFSGSPALCAQWTVSLLASLLQTVRRPGSVTSHLESALLRPLFTAALFDGLKLISVLVRMCPLFQSASSSSQEVQEGSHSIGLCSGSVTILGHTVPQDRPFSSCVMLVTNLAVRWTISSTSHWGPGREHLFLPRTPGSISNTYTIAGNHLELQPRDQMPLLTSTGKQACIQTHIKCF